MYSAFMEKMGERMRGIFHDIRKSGRKPGWMLDGIYNELCELWAREDYQAVRQRNKANRLSVAGAPTYAGGSQSVNTIIKKHEAATGQSLSTETLYGLTFVTLEDREKLLENVPAENAHYKKTGKFPSEFPRNFRGTSKGIRQIIFRGNIPSEFPRKCQRQG